MSLFSQHLPSTVASLPFASSTLAKVAQDLASGKRFDHLLLYGSPGTGKSTIVETIFRERYPQVGIRNYLHEGVKFDSSDLAKIENQMGMDYSMLAIDQSITIINEVDQLGDKLLARLKAVMDNCKGHKFLLTTNHIGKIHGNIQNRCSMHQVVLPPAAVVVPFLQRVASSQGKALSTSNAHDIFQAVGTDWRRLERAVQGL
jgi:DNA polymerase III delta prime subunit